MMMLAQLRVPSASVRRLVSQSCCVVHCCECDEARVGVRGRLLLRLRPTLRLRRVHRRVRPRWAQWPLQRRVMIRPVRRRRAPARVVHDGEMTSCSPWREERGRETPECTSGASGGVVTVRLRRTEGTSSRATRVVMTDECVEGMSSRGVRAVMADECDEGTSSRGGRDDRRRGAAHWDGPAEGCARDRGGAERPSGCRVRRRGEGPATRARALEVRAAGVRRSGEGLRLIT